MTSGPNAHPAHETPAAPYFLGVDVGGTNIKLGILDNLGTPLASESIPSVGSNGAEGAIRRTAEACRTLAQQAGIEFAEIVRAGLGTPGPMDLKRGMLLNPSNLPEWHNFPVADKLSQALAKPVSFINDANAAAFGEFWVGVGKSYQSLALLTLGTGVGGGLISEGMLINGVNSFGSEVGHVVVDCSPQARLCVWGGGRGQLEAYASASAVAAQANKAIRDVRPTKMSRVVRERDGLLTAKDVYEAAVQGDDVALEIIDETAFYLGVGVTNVIHMIDPGLVVLGGAMNFGGAKCPVGRRFLQRVIDEFQARTFPNVFAGTRIDFASLGGDAGYIGAAGIARQDFQAGK